MYLNEKKKKKEYEPGKSMKTIQKSTQAKIKSTVSRRQKTAKSKNNNYH